jgi:hypothetical protein
LKILSNEEIIQLKELAKSEAGLINMGFKESKHLGLVFLSNSLTSFEENYLKPKYGEVLTSFSTEYRVLVVEILKNIDDAFKNEALREILLPKVKRFTNEDVFKILKEK